MLSVLGLIFFFKLGMTLMLMLQNQTLKRCFLMENMLSYISCPVPP